MPQIKKLKKDTEEKLKSIDKKIRTSFFLIRQDINEMQSTIDAMRNYLKKKDKQYTYAQKKDNKIRSEFRKNVDEFTQKISELKIALNSVRTIQKELVLKKDLAKIEDNIKTSFKNEIESYKKQIKELKTEIKEQNKRINHLESGKILEKKKAWFFKRKEK